MNLSFLRREEREEEDILFPDGIPERESQRISSLLIF
jgi:hypothetical protein